MHARVAQIGHDGLCRISSVASDVPPFVSFVVTHSQSATLWQWRPLYNALMTYALCPNDLCPNALCPNALFVLTFFADLCKPFVLFAHHISQNRGYLNQLGKHDL